MHILKKHILLFDAECLVCVMAANFFKQSGLQKETYFYQSDSIPVCHLIDKQKVTKGIALINLQTGKVLYGAESVLQILSILCPWFNFIFKNNIFRFIVTLLYNCFAYNRKIIFPTKIYNDYLSQAQKKYRFIYLIFIYFFTAYLFSKYLLTIKNIILHNNIFNMSVLFAGQLIFQYLMLIFYTPKKSWIYAEHLLSINFIASLLFIPMLFFGRYFQFNHFIYTIYFIVVLMLMCIENMRRCKLLGLHWYLTCTWLLYFIVALLLLEKGIFF